MRVHISYTVEVDNEERWAINRGSTKADRNEVKSFFRSFGEDNLVLDDMVLDLQIERGEIEPHTTDI